MINPPTKDSVSLTKVLGFSRKAIKVLAVIAFVILFGRMFLKIGKRIWLVVNPPPPAPPTVGFGTISGIKFPEQKPEEKAKSYTLELASNTFPVFSDRSRVYLMQRSQRSILSEERATSIASALGFSHNKQLLDDSSVRWSSSSPLESMLYVDLVTLNSKMRSDYLSRAELINKDNLPLEKNAISQTFRHASKAYELADDLANGQTEIVLYKSLGGELVKAAAYSDADFMEVNVLRSPIVSGKKTYGFVTPKGKQGILRAIFKSGTSYQKNIVEFDYLYQAIVYDQYHTYPLRSVESAWEIVKAGEAYIVNKDDREHVVIRNVRLAYYDLFDKEQDYMQPVYVFEGDGGSMSYVPAISPEWLL